MQSMKNACLHGWHETKRSAGEVCALICSELYEALDEYRNHKPNVYVVGDNGEIITDIAKFDGRKPEGIAVELADAAIRVLDHLGDLGINADTVSDDYDSDSDGRFDCWDDFGEFIMIVNKQVSDAWCNGIPTDLCYALCAIEWYFYLISLDLAKIIMLKHEYNKTRPYRHGNKRI